MSWIHLGDTQPKGKKDYGCDLCEEVIAKGTVHVARRGIDDDGPATVRFHSRCEELSKLLDWDDMDWETRDPSEFREMLAQWEAGSFVPKGEAEKVKR